MSGAPAVGTLTENPSVPASLPTTRDPAANHLEVLDMNDNIHSCAGAPDHQGCMAWLGPVDAQGYGRHGKEWAHRFVYEMTVGPIPSGLQLDHLCRNRRCVNPDHLEPVTSRENTLRGDGPTAQNARKSHCHRGHPFSGDNLFVRSDGTRRCRACHNLRTAASARRRRDRRN